MNGVLTADVTAGLPAGAYRLCSINSSSNHQPVIVAVAQHGSLDDCVYVCHIYYQKPGLAAQISVKFTATGNGGGAAATTAAGTTKATTTAKATTKAATATATTGKGAGRGGRGVSNTQIMFLPF